MEQILIAVETIQQRDKVLAVLEKATQDSLYHVGGELDFPFDVWKLHRSDPQGKHLQDLCPRPTHP